MGYRRFEDLPVWKDAIELAVRTFAVTSTGCLKGFAGLRDQTRKGGRLDLEQCRRGIRARDE